MGRIESSEEIIEKELLSDRIERISQNLSKGVYNFMPFNWEGFSKVVPGMIIEPQIITANTSGGKSSITKFLYVFKAIQFAIKNKVDYNIIYFALEDNELLIKYSILCSLYWEEYKELIDINLLEGYRFDNNCKPKIPTSLQKERIKKLEPLLETYMTYITVIDDVYNSNGIYKEVKKWATKFGTFYNKDKVVTYLELREGAKWTKFKKKENTFLLCVIDHVSLLNPDETEKELYKAMANMFKYGKQYIVKKLGIPFLMVQQQAEETTNLDHIKSNYFLPTEQGLGDNKASGKISRMTLGITAPFKFNQKTFRGYDLEEMKGFYRSINVIKQTIGEVGRVFDLLFIPQVNYFYILPFIKKGETIKDDTREFINTILLKIKEYEEI